LAFRSIDFSQLAYMTGCSEMHRRIKFYVRYYCGAYFPYDVKNGTRSSKSNEKDK